jgi:hypothetical protein
VSDSTGLTGGLFEEKVIGRCKAEWTRVYMCWIQAVEEVRKNQPPVHERPSFTAKWVRLVSEKLGQRVLFRTAIGSAADYLHGIDGFFELESGEIVTIDLTTNPCKDACKADLLVTLEDVRNLPALAARVAGAFHTKMLRRAA